MEPVKVTLKTKIEKIEEKFHQFNWRHDEQGQTTYDRLSLGWYIQFEGSSESLHLFDTKPPWQVGDDVTITFERVNNAKP